MTRMLKEHNVFRDTVVRNVVATAQENSGSDVENMDTEKLTTLADRVVSIYVNNTENAAHRKIHRVLKKNAHFSPHADVISERMMNTLHQNFS